MVKACLPLLFPLALRIAVGIPLQAGELDTHIPLHDKGIATYYVEGHIDGAGVIDLLVDTGAGYTAINEKTLRTLRRKGLATHIKDMSARLADGSRVVVPIYRIAKLNIGGSCEVYDVEVAVLPGSSRCILGLGTLKKVAPFMVSVDPPRLSLSNCGKTLSKNAVGAVH
jgi:predicted aspartyl protease